MKIEIIGEKFDPWQSLVDYKKNDLQNDPKIGASSVFLGTMRDFNEDDDVTGMELQHYPGMTEAQIRTLALESAYRHGVDAVLVIHRVGQLPKGEPIVLVAVAANRRGPAMRCGQEVLEALKHRAPFWKREWCDGEGVWLSGNTSL